MKLERKYGLLTAIGMVVGVVIGSGVFFKAQTILNNTEGNMGLGIIAWIIGGIIMIISSLSFAVMASLYENVNGVVDYTEATCGKKYAYLMAWFMISIYSPSMTGVLAWVSARYFGELFGWEYNSGSVMVIAGLFLIASFTLNSLAPKLAGKFQVSTTFIKLVPILLMAVVGTIYGLVTTEVKYITGLIDNELTVIKEGSNHLQILIENFKHSGSSGFGVLLAAVVSTVFAYEGWVLACSINSELKDSKKNLPVALIVGSLIVIAIYVVYYIGVAGGATIDVLRVGGARYAFLQIFGDFFGTILTVFIVISCLGTLNGLMLATSRGFYAISVRNEGPRPDIFNQVDKVTNVPTNSAIIGLLFCSLWLIYFYGANLVGDSWFGVFSFDSSELPIVTIYAMYIPIFILLIIKERKNLGIKRGIILPVLSIFACSFMVFAAVYAHEIKVLYYLVLYVVIMGIGMIFLYKKSQLNNEKSE